MATHRPRPRARGQYAALRSEDPAAADDPMDAGAHRRPQRFGSDHALQRALRAPAWRDAAGLSPEQPAGGHVTVDFPAPWRPPRIWDNRGHEQTHIDPAVRKRPSLFDQGLRLALLRPRSHTIVFPVRQAPAGLRTSIQARVGPRRDGLRDGLFGARLTRRFAVAAHAANNAADEAARTVRPAPEHGRHGRGRHRRRRGRARRRHRAAATKRSRGRARLARPFVYVAGNHEFYGVELRNDDAELREPCAGSDVHVLDDEALVLGGVRFLGPTLWTDFALYGHGDPRAAAYRRGGPGPARLLAHPARRSQRAVHARRVRGAASPPRGVARRAAGRAARGPDGRRDPPRAVAASIHARFAGSLLNPCFISDAEHLVGGGRAAAVDPRPHARQLRLRPRGTRVLCNPRGYMLQGVNENAAFDPALVVEVV